MCEPITIAGAQVVEEPRVAFDWHYWAWLAAMGAGALLRIFV